MSDVAMMNRHVASTVDAREMLCAQALALVAQALARAPVGAAVCVLYNTPDVQSDLLAWAAQRGYPTGTEQLSTLWIERAT